MKPFDAIKKAATAALEYVKENPDEFTDPINFADLKVVDILYCADSRGEVGWAVHIEEAAPEAAKVKRYVQMKVWEQTSIRVDVITEW